MNARSTAIANEGASIDASQKRAIAAKEAEQRPRNAMEAMARRLQVSTDVLKTTLQKTAFSTCRSNEEFVSMVIVANEYGLNPLLKEIYAFPAKGGGVVPMVGVDGWIRLMNEHPAFDGIEFDYINDEKGKIEAIEAVVYRKDRNHPIKIIEYLEECKRNTEPWNKSPRRMLRHRAMIQGVRIAFGFSGMVAEGDEDEFSPIVDVHAEPKTLPSKRSSEEILDGDGIPDFDNETGEIIDKQPTTDSRGMTEVDEETARNLDANDGTLSEENPTAEEGPAQEQRGEYEKPLPKKAQNADYAGPEAPSEAELGQSWYNTDRNTLLWAHSDPDGGLVWYVSKPKPDAPDATYTGAKPSSASRGETWWDGEKLRHAHETPNGIKWYLKPQEDTPESEPEQEGVSSEDSAKQADMPPWMKEEQRIRDMLNTAATSEAISKADAEFVKIAASLPDRAKDNLEAMFRDCRAKLRG